MEHFPPGKPRMCELKRMRWAKCERSRLTRLPIKCWGNSGRLSPAQRINCFSQRPHAIQCRFNATCSTDPDSRDSTDGILQLVVLAGKKTDQQDGRVNGPNSCRPALSLFGR